MTFNDIYSRQISSGKSLAQRLKQYMRLATVTQKEYNSVADKCLIRYSAMASLAYKDNRRPKV